MLSEKGASLFWGYFANSGGLRISYRERKKKAKVSEDEASDYILLGGCPTVWGWNEREWGTALSDRGIEDMSE